MSAHPTNDEIMQALLESGYLLEQHVATILESLGFNVWTNAAFEDPEEHKSREIDVRAIRRVAHNETRKVSAFVELIVECKNSSNALVFVSRTKNQVDRETVPSEWRFPMTYKMTRDLGSGRSEFREASGFFHLGFDQVHYRYKQLFKAVQFCRIDRKGSAWHANHAGLYDAIFYPIAKAVRFRLDQVPKSSDTWKYLWLVFPIVVTKSDLFLVDSSAVQPEPVQQSWVGFSRELKSKIISGTYALDFVRFTELEAFVKNSIGSIVDRARELVETETDFLLRAELPWHD